MLLQDLIYTVTSSLRYRYFNKIQMEVSTPYHNPRFHS